MTWTAKAVDWGAGQPKELEDSSLVKALFVLFSWAYVYIYIPTCILYVYVYACSYNTHI